MDMRDIEASRQALLNGAVFVADGRGVALMLPGRTVRGTVIIAAPLRAPVTAANDNGDRFGRGAGK